MAVSQILKSCNIKVIKMARLLNNKRDTTNLICGENY